MCFDSGWPDGSDARLNHVFGQCAANGGMIGTSLRKLAAAIGFSLSLGACGAPVDEAAESAAPSDAAVAEKPPIIQASVARLGEPTPTGVSPSGEYLRVQLEDFLSDKAGYRVRLSEVVEVSGSGHTEYCGNMGTPDGDGELRWFKIGVWSEGPIDHQITFDELECGEGRMLIKSYEVVSQDESGMRPAGTVTYGRYQAAESPTRTGDSARALLDGARAERGSMHNNIDRVTTYAVLIGRGLGCGVDVKPQVARVGAWLDRIAPPGSEAQRTLLPMFTEQSQYHAGQQIAGKSPDGCAAVARAIRNHPWPS